MGGELLVRKGRSEGAWKSCVRAAVQCRLYRGCWGLVRKSQTSIKISVQVLLILYIACACNAVIPGIIKYTERRGKGQQHSKCYRFFFLFFLLSVPPLAHNPNLSPGNASTHLPHSSSSSAPPSLSTLQSQSLLTCPLPPHSSP